MGYICGNCEDDVHGGYKPDPACTCRCHRGTTERIPIFIGFDQRNDNWVVILNQGAISRNIPLKKYMTCSDAIMIARMEALARDIPWKEEYEESARTLAARLGCL